MQQPPTNQTGDFYIYENSNYIPMGFRFRYAMFESEYSLIPEEMRDDVLLAALILPDDGDPSAYGLSVVDSSAAMALVNSISDEISYHRDTAAKDFAVTGKGFSSVVDSDTDGIVFFSIPYSESFSVTVNGEHVDPCLG